MGLFCFPSLEKMHQRIGMQHGRKRREWTECLDRRNFWVKALGSNPKDLRSCGVLSPFLLSKHVINDIVTQIRQRESELFLTKSAARDAS